MSSLLLLLLLLLLTSNTFRAIFTKRGKLVLVQFHKSADGKILRVI